MELRWVDAFYFPAGINLVIALAWGTPAVLGIFLGSAGVNLTLRGLPFWDSLLLALATPLVLLAIILLHSKRVGVREGWQTPTIRAILLYTAGYILLNPIMNHILFYFALAPEAVTIASLLSMVVGDLLGILMIFTAATLISVAWVWWHTSGAG